MAIERIQLIPDAEMQKKVAEYQIDAGLITAAEFAAKPAEEQEAIKAILFDKFAGQVNPFVGLSGLEFAVVGLAKIYFKKAEGVALTAAEETFYTQFKALMTGHEMTMDANDWYFSYLAYQMQKVAENRAAYKAKKMETTGEF